MYVTKPFTVTDANLDASSLAENDHTAYNGGTAYTVGQKCISTTTHSVYECMIDCTGVDPDTDTSDPPKWLRLGATNRWKPFDKIISDPATSSAQTITYSLDSFTEPATGLTAFGLYGVSVQLVVTDSIDGEVFNQTVSLVDNRRIINWFDYFFEPGRYRTEAIFSGIPPYATATYDLTFTAATGETPEIGQIVLGREYWLGLTVTGTSISIADYSIKDRDDFGNAIIVERAFSKRVDFDFAVSTPHANRALTLLSEVRAIPAVYSAGSDTEQFGTTVYGFFKDWSISLDGPTISNGTIEVEGLS